MTMDTEQITVVQSAGTPAPRVSVLMAAHNGNAFIGYTLHSILAQRFSDFEVVIVDDASIDGTADVVRGFDDKRIRLISTPRNMGPPGARNVGYAACRGEYIAPVDQDDLWLPLRLARQVAYLDRHDEAALVATATDRLVDGKRLASPEPVRTSPGFLRWALMTGNPLVWSSVMIRRASLHAAGGPFNREDRRFAEDFDLYHRLQRVGTIGRIDEVLTTYRSHAAGASRVFGDKMMASAIRVLEDAYEPILGANASRAAQAMARHVGGGEPVPDLKTLQLIQAVLQAMTQYV
ncbi:MAG TPA: glycosyltransferase family A protein, partial [Acetobacteraceae bacterium]|nr:glycosyltransferase family A protein [Acetobacteraceae bacterium]